MNGFITKSGTKYYLDMVNQMICGGRIKHPTQYYKCSSLLIGSTPIFYLINGRILKTTVVVDHF